MSSRYLPGSRPMTGLRRRTLYILLWGAVALLAVQFTTFALDSATRETGGFGAYYAAAHVVASGEETSGLYDDDWFQRRIDRIGLDVRDIYRPNPPTVAALTRPLAMADHGVARAGWIAFGLIVLGAALLAMVRLAGLHGIWIPLLLALTLSYQPLLADIDHAQAYSVLLGLLTLVWAGYRERWNWLAGAVLGILLAVKTLGAFILGLLAVERRWRALGSAIGVVLVVSLASLVWVDPATWRAYLDQLIWMEDRAKLTVTAYQSQPGLIGHLLLFDRQWNQEPIADAPVLALLLTVVSSVAVLLATAYLAIKSDNRDIVFAAVVLVTVFLTPLSLDYHYTLLLLPIVVLLGWVRGESSPWLWATFALGVVLIAASLPYRSPRFGDGLWALFAYPKLYGAWLLWGICIWSSLPWWRETGAEDREAGQYGIGG